MSMNVGQLMAELVNLPVDMEIVICKNTGGYGYDHDIYDLGEACVMSRTIGICNPNPKTYDVLRLDTDMCGA